MKPGTRAGYQTSVVALLLAEIVSRKRGRDFRDVVRDEVFLPLGMKDSWLGMPAAAIDHYRDRLGQTFDTSGPEPKPIHGRPTRRSISCISCLEAMAVDQWESWRAYLCFCTDVARLTALKS